MSASATPDSNNTSVPAKETPLVNQVSAPTESSLDGAHQVPTPEMPTLPTMPATEPLSAVPSAEPSMPLPTLSPVIPSSEPLPAPVAPADGNVASTLPMEPVATPIAAPSIPPLPPVPSIPVAPASEPAAQPLSESPLNPIAPPAVPTPVSPEPLAPISAPVEAPAVLISEATNPVVPVISPTNSPASLNELPTSEKPSGDLAPQFIEGPKIEAAVSAPVVAPAEVMQPSDVPAMPSVAVTTNNAEAQRDNYDQQSVDALNQAKAQDPDALSKPGFFESLIKGAMRIFPSKKEEVVAEKSPKSLVQSVSVPVTGPISEQPSVNDQPPAVEAEIAAASTNAAATEQPVVPASVEGSPSQQ